MQRFVGKQVVTRGEADLYLQICDYDSRFSHCFSYIFFPHSSNAVQRHFPCSMTRARIDLMCSSIASSSTILRFLNFCQRTEAGVPVRNPKKSSLISSSVKPVCRAL